MKMTFGKTWWGQQWLNSLNNIDYDNRLPRGRSYANKGAVIKIDIHENMISAKVEGSRPKPYKVDVILPPFFDPELSDFIAKLAQKPSIVSKLLNRQLDKEVLGIAEKMGLKVFPKQWTDFKMQCSCPDWAVPCKHLAAVIYKVSAEIDNNPFLVFELHRVNLEQELAKIGVYLNRESTEVPRLKDLYFAKGTADTKKVDPEKAYIKLPFSGLASIHEPLVALLEDNPVFYPGLGDFKEKYARRLKKVVANAQRVIKGKVSLENVFLEGLHDRMAVNPHAREALTVDDAHVFRVLVNDTDFEFEKFLYELSLIKSGRTIDYQPSTAVLHTVLWFSAHLLAKGAFVPQIVQLPNKSFKVRWLPAMLSAEVRNLVEKLEGMLPPHIFLWVDKKTKRPINKEAAVNLLSVFLTETIKALSGKEDKDEYVNFFFRNEERTFSGPGEEAINGAIMSWLQKYYLGQSKHKPQLVVEEMPGEKFKVSVNIVGKGISWAAPVPFDEIWGNSKYEKVRFEILQTLSQLSVFVKGLDDYIDSRGQLLMEMDMANFTPFLMQAIPAIRLLDVEILLPKALREILKPKASIKLKAKNTSGKSYIRLDQLLDFDWQVAIGDTLLNEGEFKKLLGKSEGLIKYKTNYIYVGHQDLEKLHKHFAEARDLSAFQLFKAALSEEFEGAKVGVSKEVQGLIEELTKVKEVAPPKDIRAILRPYQLRGYSWMYRNACAGFGSVWADDMGLGKTLQVICTLAKFREEGLLEKEKALVVSPTGLLSNWQAEIEKFAPFLRLKLYHGNNRKLEKNEEFDILLSSYGVLRSDAAQLKKMKWYVVVIDEAQNIKNVNTKQTKAVKSIRAQNFIAMSGTPVENKLSEFWSIMDFGNRGFLGNVKEFDQQYGVPIQSYNDVEAAEKLKKVTAPFMMRRLKSDKSIISDLPDKIEMDSFASLAKEQAGLYEKTLEIALKEIEEVEGSDQKSLFTRQGLVLQMILALKQICNHPTQYLKNQVLDPELSGKVRLLFDKLDSIVESGEKVLIFTQFTEMAKLLRHFISERYGEAPLFYHGGCSMTERKHLVDSFQANRADKVFILTLKSAGTGLNLTAANHVIHYDLWWNPAVEAQATDRAYRIGQKSNVMVHRFITKSTFEERINEMIQGKKALAEMTVNTGESWIGNLSNKELRDLFVMS